MCHGLSTHNSISLVFRSVLSPGTFEGMDFSLLQKLAAATTMRRQPLPSVNPITVNTFGDVFMLGQDILFGNLRPKNNDSDVNSSTLAYKKLRIGAFGKTLNFSDYDNISCNADGSVLLLYSTTKVAIVEIPSKNFEKGYLEDCVHECSFHQIFDAADCASTKTQIVKATFHPLNQFAVLILQQTKYLTIYDVRTHDKVRIIAGLPNGLVFTSFTCGPDIEWLRFTVILSASDGNLYALCPIIPAGTKVSISVVEELWQWVDGQREIWSGSLNEEDRLRLRYVELLEVYLQDLFGDVSTLLPADSAHETFVVAGEMRCWGSSQRSSSTPCLADYNVVLQRLTNRTEQERSKSKTRASSLDSRASKDDDQSNVTDLCVPHVSGPDALQAPVFATVRVTGFVEVYLLDASVRLQLIYFDSETEFIFLTGWRTFAERAARLYCTIFRIY